MSSEEASSFIHLNEALTMSTFAPYPLFRLSQPDNSTHISDSQRLSRIYFLSFLDEINVFGRLLFSAAYSVVIAQSQFVALLFLKVKHKIEKMSVNL